MAIELRGFDDLQNDMINMAYALDQGPGVNRALKAGAVPIEEQMLHNASTDPKIITDALHSSIHTGKVKQKRGGGKQITIQNLTVVRVDAEKNLLLVKGAVPGSRKAYVTIKETVKTVD